MLAHRYSVPDAPKHVALRILIHKLPERDDRIVELFGGQKDVRFEQERIEEQVFVVTSVRIDSISTCA